MNSNRVSASKLSLARKCVYPWVSDLEWNDKPGWSARLGTALHTMADGKKPDNWLSPDGTRERGSKWMTARQREIATGMFIQYQEWADAHHADLVGAVREVAFWYCPATETSGILPKSDHRDYSLAPPGAFCATLDILFRIGAPIDLVDLKTGFTPTPPEESDQLKFQALAVATQFDLEEVNVGVLAVREHNHAFMTARFSELTMDLVRSEVRRVYLAVKAGDGPTPGKHCNRCPIKEKCEASEYVRPGSKTVSAGNEDEAA